MPGPSITAKFQSTSGKPFNKQLPPLSLYVHIPWCVRKCPYCDFNSHQSDVIPEQEYVQALLNDLATHQSAAQGRPLQSIFFGGGTPSLFKAESIGQILEGAEQALGFSDDIEITLEANPGTAEYPNLKDLKVAGVNRLSFGIQSFNDQHLQLLGRIHSGKEALTAYDAARRAGFNNINLDLMHGLAQQTPEQAQADLEQAIALAPEHLSWYQLTIEPNTVFYSKPPVLPEDDILADIQDLGLQLLAQAQYKRYEVSAYAREHKRSQHNMNYWQFGDYLAIGAGAHGKITWPDSKIERYWNTRLPADYLCANQSDSNKSFCAGSKVLAPKDLPFEFLMNAMRLTEGFKEHLFETRTGLTISPTKEVLTRLQQRELIEQDEVDGQIIWRASEVGFQFLNTTLSEFLD